MKTLWIISLLCIAISGFGFTAVPEVLACSGGGTDNVQDLLSRTQFAVKADVVSVDDVRQNALLHVDSVLYGGASPEYLLFVQTDPVIVTRITEGDPYGNCNFFQPELTPGSTAYFFLARRDDGAYLSTTYWHDPNYYAFPDADTTFRLYSRDENDDYVEHVLNEQDFVDFVTEFGQSQLTEPLAASTMPRLAPLKITTADGTAYILPVDNDTPVEVTDEFLRQMTITVMGYDSTYWNEAYFTDSVCPGYGCTQVSPDGINRAEQRGDEIHWFAHRQQGIVPGRAFTFSSAGDAIAIWHEDRIEFYTLGWKKYDQPFAEVIRLNAVSLAGDIGSLSAQAAWSPDGRWFAYSDAKGLWLLDVYRASAVPIQLLPAEAGTIPLALRFSPLGRYLQVQRGDERLTLDVVSGDVFPDGLVSPDDQILLAYDTQTAEFDVQICYLAPVRDCEPINTLVFRTITDEDTEVYTAYTRYREVQWRSSYSFIVTICQRDNPDACIVDRIESRGSHGIWYNGQHWVEGDTFDYFVSGDAVAVVQDDFTLLLNGETYDLSATLDSPIDRIEWLPSLFYEAR